MGNTFKIILGTNKNKCWVAILLLIFCCDSSFSDSNIINTMPSRAYLVKRKPNDKESIDWEKYPDSTVFVPFSKRYRLKVKTNFKAAYDDHSLFLKITCEEPDIKNIKANVKKHDGPVYTDDCLEIFLAPTLRQDMYFQFVVNSLGAKFEGGKLGKKRFSAKWNGQWQANSSQNSNSWVTEITIPFKSLELPMPRAGSIWRGNVCRERHCGGRFELSTWANVTRSFHYPPEFGVLAFDDFQPDLNGNLKIAEEKINIWKNRIMENLHPVDTAYSKDKTKLDKLEKIFNTLQKACTGSINEPHKYLKYKQQLSMLPEQYKNLAIDIEFEKLLK